MGHLGDRLGEYDDNSVIYRADDPAQKIHWRRLAMSFVVGSLVAAVLLFAADRLIGGWAAQVVVLVLTVVFLVAYLVWRRRRNARLTGSPTTWPNE